MHATGDKKKAFIWSLVSGICEPFGALFFSFFWINYLTPFVVHSMLSAVAGVKLFFFIYFYFLYFILFLLILFFYFLFLFYFLLFQIMVMMCLKELIPNSLKHISVNVKIIFFIFKKIK